MGMIGGSRRGGGRSAEEFDFTAAPRGWAEKSGKSRKKP